MTKRPSDQPQQRKVARSAPALLLVVSLAESLLALYQWMELLFVRAGGTAICALSETVNCDAVWSSPLASRLHGLLGVPVAGLGLAWGLTAFGLSVLLAHRLIAGGSIKPAIAALKLTAATGVLACVTFAVASFRAGAVCLTCLGTYAVVLAFAVVAFKLVPGVFPPPRSELKPALGWALGLLVPIHLALLFPGSRTPRVATSASEFHAPGAAASKQDREKQVARYLEGLEWAEKQAVSDSLSVLKGSPAPDLLRFSPRARWGSDGAPMKLVEFTDIRCAHCRALVSVVKRLKKAMGGGQLSVEARHFPLDGECNKLISQTDGSGISCTGAKAQICLEGAPDYWELREQLFEAQQGLTQEKILEIASSGSVSRAQLEACIASPDTQRKLVEDLSYAALFAPRGTPVVVINGREGTPAPSFLYAMAMLGADAESKVFDVLPPPREARHLHDDHAGHGQ